MMWGLDDWSRMDTCHSDLENKKTKRVSEEGGAPAQDCIQWESMTFGFSGWGWPSPATRHMISSSKSHQDVLLGPTWKQSSCQNKQERKSREAPWTLPVHEHEPNLLDARFMWILDQSTLSWDWINGSLMKLECAKKNCLLLTIICHEEKSNTCDIFLKGICCLPWISLLQYAYNKHGVFNKYLEKEKKELPAARNQPLVMSQGIK